MIRRIFRIIPDQYNIRDSRGGAGFEAISINEEQVLLVGVGLVVLPAPHVVDHVSLVLAVGEGGVLLAEDAGGGLLVEALLLLEEHLLRLEQQRPLVLVLLLVDDQPHRGQRALATGCVGHGQGVADALNGRGGTARESPSEPGCRSGRGSARVGKMSCSCESALSSELVEDMGVYDQFIFISKHAHFSCLSLILKLSSPPRKKIKHANLRGSECPAMRKETPKGQLRVLRMEESHLIFSKNIHTFPLPIKTKEPARILQLAPHSERYPRRSGDPSCAQVQYLMKIRSAFFKRQFDLAKAQLVGRGTFAEVFRVFDAELKENLAVRRVRKSLGDPEDIAKERQINEELRKVENENILKIYDIIEQPDTVWYITEYCSGGSLWDALNLCPDNRLDERESMQCVLQISRGVQELHNHRITHRDLKPENILLKTKYTRGKPLPLIKLADFGLSTQKIIMETIAGTKEYIAPEQAKFHNYTNAVDVWSLGIILDEVLHGTPFYSGEDNKEVFSKILKTPFRVRNQAIRPAIKDLLVALLKKKPYERPIIAVIRATVEKILEEIDAESAHSAQLAHQKSTSIEHLNSIVPEVSDLKSESKLTKNNSEINVGTPSKENITVFSKKTYEVVIAGKEKLQLAKEVSPLSKEGYGLGKGVQSERKVPEISKNISPINARREEHPFTEHKLAIEKQNTIKSDIVDTDRSKIERRPISKVESASKSPQMMVVNEKITILKSEKRKMVNSSIRRDDYRCEVLSLEEYGQRMVKVRGELSSSQLKLGKQLTFIPNTYLTANSFNGQGLAAATEEPLQQFKRGFAFMNCVSTSEDYEIRLLMAERELEGRRERAEEEFFKVQQTIKQIFLSQLEAFIDQYIDKVLR